jgi:hypothetical protein
MDGDPDEVGTFDATGAFVSPKKVYKHFYFGKIGISSVVPYTPVSGTGHQFSLVKYTFIIKLTNFNFKMISCFR